MSYFVVLCCVVNVDEVRMGTRSPQMHTLLPISWSTGEETVGPLSISLWLETEESLER